MEDWLDFATQHLSLLVWVGVIIFSLLLFVGFGKVRIQYRRHLLGNKWRHRPSKRGRDVWELISNDGRVLDEIREANGRWKTRWGREFRKLKDAADFVAERHSGPAKGSEPAE